MNSEPLFTIDVASQIRSLCEAQLRGTWQMPAELVRFAIQRGVEKVEVSIGRRAVTLAWTGDSVEKPTLESLAVALDPGADPASRQRALAGLERSGAEVLLWAGGVAGSSLRISGKGNAGATVFESRNGRCRIATDDSGPASGTTAVRWSCPDLDRRRARRWLRLACRFCRVRVEVDGLPVAPGFAGGLYRLRLEEPLPVELGLTSGGEEPVLWLMRDGVVAARAVLPGYPPFEAAVELGAVVSRTASGADLRRAVTPYLAELSDRAAWMMIQVLDRPDRVAGPFGQRLLDLLLRAVRSGLREREIRNLPMIPTCGHPRLLSMVRLEALARPRGGRLFAVEPGAATDDLLVDPSSTVIVSPRVRPLLSELTGVRLLPPPRRQTGSLRRFTEGVGRRVRWVVERCRGAVGGRALPADQLTRGERRLLGSLRAVLSPRSVDLGGARGLQRTSKGLILPRSDPAVRAAVEVSGDEPAWLYPLVLSLRLGEPPPRSLRNRWTSLMERFSV